VPSRRRKTGSLNKIQRIEPGLYELPAKLQVDGDFGASTKYALMQFQRLKKLPAHGRLDEATRKALGVSSFKENLEKIAWNNAVSVFCQALLCSAEFRYLD